MSDVRAVFKSVYLVATMREPRQCIRFCNRSERLLDRSIQRSIGPCPYRPQRRLDLRPAPLNRRQVWRVRRQVDQLRASRFNGFANAAHFMCSQVIHDHNVARLKCRAEDAFRISTEDLAIRRPCNRQQRVESAATQGADQRDVLAIVERRAAGRSLATRGAAIPAGQGQIDAGFINELEALQIESADRFLVLRARLLDSGRIALGGVERLFFLGKLSACSKRHRVGRETFCLCLRSTFKRNSASVRSLFSLTSSCTKRRAWSCKMGGLPPG